MTFLDFMIDLVGEIAGWSAIILGLAWACGKAARREIYIIHKTEGGGDNGRGPARPAPDPGGAFRRRVNYMRKRQTERSAL